MRIPFKTLVLAGSIIVTAAATANASITTYVNNLPGFTSNAGPNLQLLDFRTLPNGMIGGPEDIVGLTDTVNYDAYGVHFSGAPVALGATSVFVVPAGSGSLRVSVDGNQVAKVIADFVEPVSAVGVLVPGAGTTLCAFDQAGAQIGCVTTFLPGGASAGIISTTPIYRVTATKSDSSQIINDFYFAPIVPEPASACLLAVGAVAFLRRRRPIR